MQYEVMLDMLTQNSVSIKKQQYIIQDEKKYEIGQPWRRAYINSASGRQQVENEITEPYKIHFL